MILIPLIKKFSTIYGTEISVPYSQEPATGQDESTPRPHIKFI